MDNSPRVSREIRVPPEVGRWTAWLYIIATGVALLIAMLVGKSRRPEMVPYIVSLYVCGWFFAHAYSVAWRGGAFFRKWGGLVPAVAVLLVLSWLHAEDASARVVYHDGHYAARAPEPLLFVATALDVGAAVLLFVHGLLLGRIFRPGDPQDGAPPEESASP